MLVLGYSSSDAFDISPQIESITEGQKNVFYLAHRSKEKGDYREEVKYISAQETKNPFKKFEGKRVFIDTNQFIKMVWKDLVKDKKYESEKEHQTPWREDVKGWIKKTREIDRLTIVGRIFYKISEYKIEKDYYKRALKISKTNQDNARVLACLLTCKKKDN